MGGQNFYVITFDSTHHAIKTEKHLKDRFKIEMIPTPREISASCGLSIKFQEREFDGILDVLNHDEGQYKVFKIERVDGSRNVTKIM